MTENLAAQGAVFLKYRDCEAYRPYRPRHDTCYEIFQSETTMSLVPTEIGVEILIALSTGFFLLLVAATILARIFWSILVRDKAHPRPTIGKSFLVATAGGVLVLPFFLLLGVSNSKSTETEPPETNPVFHITNEEDRARRSGIESLRNHLLILNRGKKNETMLPQPSQRRSRDVWMIPYASGMRYSYLPDEADGPYLVLEPEILGGKRYAIERTTFDVVEVPKGGTE